MLCVPTPYSSKRMIAFLKIINEADLSWMYLERKAYKKVFLEHALKISLTTTTVFLWL